MLRRDVPGVRAGVLVVIGTTTLLTGLLVAPAGPSAAGAATGPSTTTGTAISGAESWTVYHGNPEGSGLGSAARVVLSSPAWTSPALDGQLYGEPLVSGGRVFVATENDTVYALSAASGAVVWSAHVGTPVPASSLPCGDISPTVGITGTPVIDAARGELFVVADEMVGGTPAHELVGLSTATGVTELRQDVDPPGATPSAQLQRTGLTLDDSHVVFGFGGNYGDCDSSSYRGWVLSVPEGGGTPEEFAVDGAPGESQGAVWMGGAAPVVDPAGDVWVATGNGSVYSSSHAYDDSEGVLELSPTMTLVQYFAPQDWATLSSQDLDLSTAPALLADGQVVAAGKARIAYLLDGSDLGGIGGEQASLAVGCGDDVDGGVAVEGTTVYLPCLSGPVAVAVSAAPAGLRVLWRSSVGGGPPVVAAGMVWTIGQDGVLYALDPTTGAEVAQATVGVPANHFPTPSVAAGLLLAPAADRVVAFSAPAGEPSPATSTTTTTRTTASSTTTSVPATTTTSAPASSGGTAPWLLAVVALGVVVVAAALTWFLRRRRR